MFVLGNFLIALGQVLGIVLNLYKWVIIIRALISWVNPDPRNPIVVFLHRATDPLLKPIERRLPPMSGIDFSPLILLLIVIFLEIFIPGTLIQIGMRFKGVGG